jgi:hypothetical protein
MPYFYVMKNVLLLIILSCTVFCGSSAYVSVSELMAVKPTVEVISNHACLNI